MAVPSRANYHTALLWQCYDVVHADAGAIVNAMSRTPQPNQSVFRMILTQISNLRSEHDIGAFYIGAGDRFDDDRRFVREPGSMLYEQIRLAQGAGSPIHWRINTTAA